MKPDVICSNPRPTRRSLLVGGLGLASAALWGCGGGGSSSTDPGSGGGGGGGGGAQPTGSLAYRNTGVVGVYSFSTRTELSFDPGLSPFVDPGMAVSRTGLVTAAREGQTNKNFSIAVFGLDGKLSTSYLVEREFSFQTSAAMFNADATRLAFSVDEPASATNNTRIARTLVFSLPGGTELTALDGYQEPVWAGSTGELIVRDSNTNALRVFDTNLVDKGPLASLVVTQLIGGYNLSADGRYVVYADASGSRLLAFDRSTGNSWVAATDTTSSLRTPALSPDGRFLAMVARDLLNYVPHVVPFAPGSTVAVDSVVHALDNTLVECRGRIGWTA